LRAVESNFEPGINSFNGWAFLGKANKANAPINLGSAGVIMGDVQYHAFFGLKQAVEISIRPGFSRQTKNILSTHTPNKAFSTAEATPLDARDNFSNCGNAFAIARKGDGGCNFGLALSGCKDAVNPNQTVVYEICRLLQR
jgi:hypothetical protein